MRYRILISAGIMFTILSFTGCGESGSGINETQNNTNQEVSTKGLTKSNYIERARYYYSKELFFTSINQKRTFVRKDESMQRLTRRSLVNHEKDTLYVKSVKSPDKYLHFLQLSYNDKLVTVETNPSKEIVSIKYSDKSRGITETKYYSFEDFLITEPETEEE